MTSTLLLIWGILHLTLTFAITEIIVTLPAGHETVATSVYRTEDQDWIPPPNKKNHPPPHCNAWPVGFLLHNFQFVVF